MTPTRRGFLARLGATAATLAFAGRSRLAALFSAGPPRTLDPALLRAVGHSVLPGEMGEEGRERAVVAFESWLTGFRPDAEGRHPYGGWIIPRGPADPEPRWSAQLQSLDSEAARVGAGFGDLPVEDRRLLLRAAIGETDETLGHPAAADHVAVGLLAHYYRSPEANDRCFGRAIGKLSCRSIDTVATAPARIE